jgi:hypothetical protein
MNTKTKLLNEILTSAGRYIVEGGSPPKFRGDSKKIAALKNAIIASKNLYEALKNENNSLDTISEAVDFKKTAAEAFKKEFGIIWPY